MIRPISPSDAKAVRDVAIASGLFATDDSAFLDKMMTDYFSGNQAAGHRCVIDVEEEVLGVAYYQPALATDRT